MFKISHDLKTTLAGTGLAGLILSQVDPQKLAQGDTHQLMLIGAAGMVAIIGYYSNKSEKPPEPPSTGMKIGGAQES